jgi:hypothetical protein
MKTSTIKSVVKVVAIIELALFACLFSHASYKQYNCITKNDMSKKCSEEFDTGHIKPIRDLVVMDDLFYAGPLANQ